MSRNFPDVISGSFLGPTKAFSMHLKPICRMNTFQSSWLVYVCETRSLSMFLGSFNCNSRDKIIFNMRCQEIKLNKSHWVTYQNTSLNFPILFFSSFSLPVWAARWTPGYSVHCEFQIKKKSYSVSMSQMLDGQIVHRPYICLKTNKQKLFLLYFICWVWQSHLTIPDSKSLNLLPSPNAI